MGINVCSLMWIRTTMNYQYRYGTATTEAMRKLWGQGGIPRFYRGLAPALFQGPLSRFGDTAANTAILALLEPYDLPMAAKTGVASLSAGLWRIFITPLDTLKTTLQVEGKEALPLLGAKIKAHGILVTFHVLSLLPLLPQLGIFHGFSRSTHYRKLYPNLSQDHTQ